MKNSLEDVKNHLIMAMERLNDDEFMADDNAARKELDKVKTISELARNVVELENAEAHKAETDISRQRIQVDAMKIAYEMGYVYKPDNMQLSEIKGISLKEALGGR